MARFLISCEVETHITLSGESDVLRFSDVAGRYSVFLRDLRADPNNPPPLLSVQIIFEAPSLQEAKSVSDAYLQEFLNFLTLVTSSKFRVHRITHLFDWEPGSSERSAVYYSGATDVDTPIPALSGGLLTTLAQMLAQPASPQLRRAIRWFANGVASEYTDDQFTFFWLSIEVLSQIVKDTSPVPDKCPRCQEALYCPTCEATPLHKPYPKQAIQQLFQRHAPKDWEALYGVSNKVRNQLTHGDDVATIEAGLKVKLPDVVDNLGRISFVALLSQFAAVFGEGKCEVLSTNTFVRTKVTTGAHINVMFTPNFDAPNPADFPDIKIKFEFAERPQATDPSLR